MINRRDLLRAGAGLLLPAPTKVAEGRLDPRAIAKYVAALPIPPAMPLETRHTDIDHYTVGVRQFRQQVLPPGRPATTVWGYGAAARPETFSYPAFTIEAEIDRPVRVRWVNQLLDSKAKYRPHLLPVDPTLHWANPPGGPSGRDSRPRPRGTPGPYTGPVPIVTHLHGGLNTEESDGYAEAWYLPKARDIPTGHADTGSFYQQFKRVFEERFGESWGPGSAVFQYANHGRAATLWFHDHTLGITRLNIYAGMAGFYLMRGGPADVANGVLPGPAPRRADPPGKRYYEIPILIQDRSFNADGSLFYPASRAFFDGFKGPYVPASDISPIWNPEFFGDTIVVNGRTWPVLAVEPRRYRFRLLNGCNTRFLILKIVTDGLARRPASPALPFWQIGNDGGFLPAPVRLGRLLIAPAERADVIVDFTALPVGAALYLINEGPDGVFGAAGGGFPAADPRTTGQVMKLVVRPLTAPDTTAEPARLRLPAIRPLGAPRRSRRVLVTEAKGALPGTGVSVAQLGVLDSGGRPVPRQWHDPITEDPVLGATEIWEIHNLTKDAHPIHIHEVQFQVLDRRSAGHGTYPPDPGERGFKDTVIAYPNGVTRVVVRFGHAGRFMWHCHILEHEDNEMMRPFRVTPP